MQIQDASGHERTHNVPALFILFGSEWRVPVAAQNKAVLHVHASGMEGNLNHSLMTLLSGFGVVQFDAPLPNESTCCHS